MIFLLETVLSAEESRVIPLSDPALFRGDSLKRFRLLYESYGEPLTRYVSRRLRPLDAAEDAVASTFEAAFRGMGKLRASQDPYLWLLGIARRKVADFYRQRARRGDQPLDEDLPASTPDPQSTYLQREQDARVRSAVMELPEEQREALLLQHLEKLSQKEISALLGKSPEAVNSLQQRARHSLQQKLAPYFPELENH